MRWHENPGEVWDKMGLGRDCKDLSHVRWAGRLQEQPIPEDLVRESDTIFI
jgi:hypothetical protein